MHACISIYLWQRVGLGPRSVQECSAVIAYSVITGGAMTTDDI